MTITFIHQPGCPVAELCSIARAVRRHSVVQDVGIKRRALDELLADALRRIVRYTPAEAHSAALSGAVLIDIRSESDRERDGVVPGSIHIPRTVFEWRTDPESPWRNPYLGDVHQQIILLCDQGYSTILAADTLVELGFTRAGDIIGGYADWREAGLPTTTSPPRRQGDELAGMRGPDGKMVGLALTGNGSNADQPRRHPADLSWVDNRQ